MPLGDRVERQSIAARALPDDRQERDVVQEVDVPERLARRGVGQVDLDERSLHPQQRVPQRDARVREAGRVDDRDVEVALVQPVDQRALMVRLEEVDVETERGRVRRQAGVDLVERLVAVDLGLARAEQVEVRSLEDQHARHAATSAGPGNPCITAAPTSSTSPMGTSLRTVTPSSVGSTQRRRPAGVLLVGRKRLEHALQWQVERLDAEAQAA